MNYFNKTVMMLTLTALLSQMNTFGMASASQPSPDQAIKESRGFIADVKAYKKCRNTPQGCPQDLKDRLQLRAAAIGTAAAGFVAGLVTAYVAPKARSRFAEWRARRRGEEAAPETRAGLSTEESMYMPEPMSTGYAPIETQTQP